MPRLMLYPLVALFSAVWSSAFIAGKIGTALLDPYSLLAWRFGLTALALSPLVLARGRAGQTGDIRAGLVLGILYNALYLGLTFTALVSVSATLVILIVSCAPFATALFAAAAGQERLDAGKLLGVAAGFGGVAVIALGQPMTRVTALGVGFAILGMLAFSLGTVLYRGRAVAGDAVRINFWQSVAGCAAMIPLCLAFGRPGTTATPELAAAVAYLALVVGVGGMGLWFLLIRVSGAATASAYHLLNPIFGLLFSHFLLGAAITARDVAGVGLICLGLAVAARRAAQPARQ
ncbi:DMT family transporter [Desulfolutivibrio sulfodismutans]|nr:DMT family transporter [Desulfolutivibrio sulfodismutans]QLA12475.1 EamA family transporter [Desulfolutivibrio sulfodismutans DSM 3696]